MKLAADTETALIRPGLAAPPLACTSWCGEDHSSGLYHATESLAPWRRWLDGSAGVEHLYGLNFGYDLGVIAAEFPPLFELIVEALFDCRLHDVGLDQRLIDIANGELDGRWEQNPDYDPAQPMKGRNKPRRWRKNKYALAELALRLWGERIAKGDDTWRKRYGTLIPVPLPRWPEDAKRYAIKDAVTTIDVHLWHCDHAEIYAGYSLDDVLVDSGAQMAAAFALHLMSCRGIRTDDARCRALIAAAEAEIERCRNLCAGLDASYVYPDSFDPLVVQGKRGAWSKKLDPAREYMIGAVLRASGVLDCPEHRAWLLSQVREFCETAQELPKDGYAEFTWEDSEGITDVKVKLTATGEVALDAEQCKEANDPILRAYATFTSATSLRTKAARMLVGARLPLQTRYHPLVATGRTSSSQNAKNSPLIGDNFQNFRRKAMKNEHKHELPGQRECIKARPGYVLCSIDLDNAEMRSEGQIAIWSEGYSNLADSLNRGEDAHLALAASQLLSSPLSYAEAYRRYKDKDAEVDNARQFAKVPNFALLGGARALTMIPYAKGMNILLTPEHAHELYAAFHSQWTEIAPMHAKVRAALRQGGGAFMLRQWVSHRLRLIDRYTVGCNSPFQGLTADGAKSALLWLAAECYTGKEYAIGADGWRPVRTGRLSPLAGAYPVLFCHDEVIFELLRARAHEQAYRARDIMIQSYNRFTPDVPMTASPALMDYWYKDAKTVHDEQGKLITWHPTPKELAKIASAAA